MGTLRIGAQESQCTYRLPPILKAFKERFPQVRLIFQPAHSDEMAKEQLLNGDLDLAFIMDESKPEGVFTVEELVPEEIRLVASSDHPLAFSGWLGAADFRGETWLLTEEGCSYRTLMEKSLQSAGVQPFRKIEFVSIEAIKQCVIAGLGIAALPAMVVEKELQTGQMKELAWKGELPPVFTHIAWHRDKKLTPPVEAFITCTRKTLKRA